jgi:hypothetical protein
MAKSAGKLREKPPKTLIRIKSINFTPDDDGTYVVTLTATATRDGGLPLAATDPSPADTLVGFTYTINWGDGTAQNPPFSQPRTTAVGLPRATPTPAPGSTWCR